MPDPEKALPSRPSWASSVGPDGRYWVRVAVGLLLLGTTVVGGARLYIAAHYATDVIAGAILGAVWLLLCIRLLRPGSVNADRQRHPDHASSLP